MRRRPKRQVTLRTAPRGLLLLLAPLLYACTDSGLQVYHPSTATTVDDKLQIDAHVCTEVPSDENFPVKVLFIVDTSDSQIVTDPNKNRVGAVVNVLQRFAGNPSVEFAVIAFDSAI